MFGLVSLDMRKEQAPTFRGAKTREGRHDQGRGVSYRPLYSLFFVFFFSSSPHLSSFASHFLVTDSPGSSTQVRRVAKQNCILTTTGSDQPTNIVLASHSVSGQGMHGPQLPNSAVAKSLQEKEIKRRNDTRKGREKRKTS